MKTFLTCLVFLSVLVTPIAHSASLPGGMQNSAVDRITEVIGINGTSRLMRSAETYETWPGMKFGFEITFISAKNLNALGDATGTLPSFNPAPRLFIAKGLVMNTELILNFFPNSEINPISSMGFMLKYAFYQEQDSWLSSSVYFGYTSLSACSNQFTASNIEVGLIASRDYVRIKPFVSLGVLLSKGKVVATQMASGAEHSIWLSTLHASIGAEIELPLNLTAQIDFMNLAVGGSFMVGKKF